MSNKLGVFINLDYANKSNDECSKIWQKIIYTMLNNGFTVEKRALVINTDKNPDELSMEVRQLFAEIFTKQSDFHSYITDCYIVNFNDFTDLTFPDTSDNHNIESISL